jgi:type IV secretion system protein VirB9
MNIAKTIVALAVAFLSAAPAHAELMATPLQGDSRLVQFNYDEDNTFLVLTKPKAVTHIQFAPDESVQSIAAGDTAQWELTPTKNRKNIFVKPRYEGLETSMTIITDKRTYQFVMKSTGDGKKWYQRVSWLYASSLVLEQDAVLDEAAAESAMPAMPGMPAMPVTRPGSNATPVFGAVDQQAATGLGIRPESLRFGYEIKGNAAFRPTNVFDDGKFTYLKMPSSLQELPALFTVIEGQDYSLVNYTVNGDYLVVQRLVTEAVLKLGKSEVRVLKKPKSKSWFSASESE